MSVKLNKTISGAQPITFSLTKSASDETLDVYVGNKKICSETATDVSAPSFCRDAKGRIFVAYYYKPPTDTMICLARCDSEGNNKKTLIDTVSGKIPLLASDLTTGKVYVLYGTTLYEVGEEELDASGTNWPSVSLSSFSSINCIAAHGGQLFVLGKQGSDYKLYVYDIELVSSPTPPLLQINLTDVTK